MKKNKLNNAIDDLISILEHSQSFHINTKQNPHSVSIIENDYNEGYVEAIDFAISAIESVFKNKDYYI